MDCEVCGRKMASTFLGKIVGTYVKDSKGKKRAVCFECQKKLPDKASVLRQLK